MNDNLRKALILIGTIFVFDELGNTTWKLVNDAVGGFAAFWFGAVFAAVSSAALFQWRDQLNTVGDSAAWLIPTIFDSQLHPSTQSKRKRIWLNFLVFLAALSLATGVAWMANAIGAKHEWWLLNACFAVVVCIFAIRVVYSRAQFEVADRNSISNEFAVLVMFLSDNYYVSNGALTHGMPKKSVKGLPSEKEVLDAFAVPRGAAHDSWMMPVLSILHQAAGNLQRVLVIPSPESYLQWNAFDKLINKWFPERKFSLEPIGKGVDYDDPKKVWITVNEALAMVEDDNATSVVMDITAGKALCSVSGAIAALQPGRTFKYINTKPPHRQHGFEISHEYEKPGNA